MKIPPRVIIRKDLRGCKTLDELADKVTAALSDLQRQSGAQPRILPHKENGKRPGGVRALDRLMGRETDGTVLGIPDDTGAVTQVTVPDKVEGLQADQEGIVPPALANFPDDGDFGWYRDTVGTITYFTWNRSGTLYSLKDISVYDFTDITGTISAAQHGVLTNNATARHSNVTTSVDGFMIAADKVILNDITTTGTVASLLNCTALQINGVQVANGNYNYTAGGVVAGPANAAYSAVEQDMLNQLKAAVNDIRAGLFAIGWFV